MIFVQVELAEDAVQEIVDQTGATHCDKWASPWQQLLQPPRVIGWGRPPGELLTKRSCFAGEDPVTVREAFAAAVKEELRNIQESMRSQEEAMVEKVAALEALYAPPAEAEAEEEAAQ
jgi:hypothetical protein